MTAKTKEEPTTFTAESIEERIAQLETELETYVAEANQRVATYNGAIAGLRGLLNGQGPDDEAEKAKE
jgi:uncharacterized small protein (DUF1192 family)